MNFKSAWSYLNKGLLGILSFMVISTLAATVYLTHTLLNLHSLTTQGSNAVGTAFVLQDLLINVQQLQSSARGYVLTGNSQFLADAKQARERIPSDIKILQTNKDLVLSRSDVEKLQTITNERLRITDEVIEIRNTVGPEAASQMIATRQGQEALEELREEINEISSKRLQNIGSLQQQSQSDTKRALWVAVAMAVLILGTSGVIIWYFRRTILHERALESTKNEFLSLASHQLRTPATNVKQYIGMILDGYMGDINDQQRHALAVAYKNNEAEITIMNNLLDVAKLDLNRIQIHKKVTNVAAIVRNVVRDYTPVAKERNQTIDLDAPKQIIASVDESYIKGVIENMVDNAIKYSHEGTRVAVTVGREQDYVFISVKDRGVGIKKRDFSKLFNKFSRLDNEFSANSQGSGLGLYWVKQIIKLHHGGIEVRSREGKGTTFTVKLPVR